MESVETTSGGRVSEEIKITIEESPYGDTGSEYEGMLGMMNHFLLQLKSFRTQQKTTEEREYLEADIRGYEQILASGSQNIARAFVKLKQDAARSGARFENNEAVIRHMKENGLWQA